MKAIYTQTTGAYAGQEICYCQQCDFRFLRTRNALDVCMFCGQNVERTMRRHRENERQRLADAPRMADKTLNGTYRDVLTGEIVTVHAASHTWEKRKIEYTSGILAGVVSFLPNWDVSHMIECRLLEKIAQNAI